MSGNMSAMVCVVVSAVFLRSPFSKCPRFLVLMSSLNLKNLGQIENNKQRNQNTAKNI